MICVIRTTRIRKGAGHNGLYYSMEAKREKARSRYRWTEMILCLCLFFLCITIFEKAITLRQSTYTYTNNWYCFFQITKQETEMLAKIQNTQIAKEGKVSSTTADIAISLANKTIVSELTSNAHEMKSVGNTQIQEKIKEHEREKMASVQAQIGSRAGMIGRLEIPSVGVDVALFSSSSQGVVDATDSAACFPLGSCMVIADHANQGFDAIKSVGVGTVAYINNGSSRTKLVCTGKCNGTNTGTDLLDNNGVSVSARSGYVFYTCNSVWQDVTVVFFSYSA